MITTRIVGSAFRGFVALALVVVASARTAHAEAPELGWDRYLRGVAAVNGTYVAVGAAGVAVGGHLVARGGDERRGAGGALIVLGGVHLAAAIFELARLPAHRARFRDLESDGTPAAFHAELSEAEAMRHRFRLFLATEAAATGIGGALAGIGEARDSGVLAGIGYAIVAEGAITLLLDGIAMRNQHAYLARLRLTVSARPMDGGAAIVATVRF